MKKILFVCYGGGHVRMVLPVLAELRRRAAVEPVILGLTAARAELQAAGWPCLGFADFVDPADADAIRRGGALAQALPTRVADLRESAAYLGLSWADLADQHGEEGADRLYARHGRQAFLPVRTLDRIIRRTGADAVVATSAPRAERAAILAARRCGLPSLCMVDLFAAYELSWLREPGYADRVCVLNERVRERLLAAGRPAAEVIVTGNPAFDSLADEELRRRGLALRRARGWEGRQVVLWASQVEPRHHPSHPGEGDPTLPVRIAERLRAMLAERASMELVVRPHPSDPAGAPPTQPREWLSGRDEELHVLLHACDLAVVMTSTVGIEARLAGLRVVQVLGSLYSEAAPYLEFGIAQEAVHLDGLPAAVARALAAPAPLPPQSGGPAAPRVADALLDLLAR
jgi:hypothetical protein